MPRDNTKRTSLHLRLVHLSTHLRNNLADLLGILILRFRNLKIAHIRQSQRANGTEFRHIKMSRVCLDYMASRWTMEKRNPKADSTRNNTYLAWPDAHIAHFSLDIENAFLWDDQHIPVRRVEGLFGGHVNATREEIVCSAVLGDWVAGCSDQTHAVEEGACGIDFEGRPHNLVGEIAELIMRALI